MAALASPFWFPTKACSASRPSFSHAAIDSLDTLAFSPSSQTIGSASSAVLACDQVSATTATPVSPTWSTCLTPGMPVTFAASKLLIVPPKTGQSLISAVDLLAGDHVQDVEPRHRLAGDLPVLRVLELDGVRIRRRKLGSSFRHLAVGGAAVRSLVPDHAVGHGQFGNRHLPLVGRGLLEHLARDCAALAHVIMRVTDAAAAAGRKVAPHTLAGNALAGRGIFPGDLRPVAFELFRDKLAEAGECALPHLRAGNADNHGVVPFDHHPGVDLRRALLGAGNGQAAERNIEAERKPATSGSSGHDKVSATHFPHVIHDCLPFHAFAAA